MKDNRQRLFEMMNKVGGMPIDVTGLFLNECLDEVDMGEFSDMNLNCMPISEFKNYLNKVLDIYAPDAIEMPPNEPIAIGREAIKKGWEEWFNDTTYLHKEITSKIDTIVVSASGDLGYVRETNHYKVKTPKGIIEFDDKCIYIYNKRKGGWKCTVGIWNSDKQPSKTN